MVNFYALRILILMLCLTSVADASGKPKKETAPVLIQIRLRSDLDNNWELRSDSVDDYYLWVHARVAQYPINYFHDVPATREAEYKKAQNQRILYTEFQVFEFLKAWEVKNPGYMRVRRSYSDDTIRVIIYPDMVPNSIKNPVYNPLHPWM